MGSKEYSLDSLVEVMVGTIDGLHDYKYNYYTADRVIPMGATTSFRITVEIDDVGERTFAVSVTEVDG